MGALKSLLYLSLLWYTPVQPYNTNRNTCKRPAREDVCHYMDNLNIMQTRFGGPESVQLPSRVLVADVPRMSPRNDMFFDEGPQENIMKNINFGYLNLHQPISSMDDLIDMASDEIGSHYLPKQKQALVSPWKLDDVKSLIAAPKVLPDIVLNPEGDIQSETLSKTHFLDEEEAKLGRFVVNDSPARIPDIIHTEDSQLTQETQDITQSEIGEKFLSDPSRYTAKAPTLVIDKVVPRVEKQQNFMEELYKIKLALALAKKEAEALDRAEALGLAQSQVLSGHAAPIPESDEECTHLHNASQVEIPHLSEDELAPIPESVIPLEHPCELLKDAAYPSQAAGSFQEPTNPTLSQPVGSFPVLNHEEPTALLSPDAEPFPLTEHEEPVASVNPLAESSLSHGQEEPAPAVISVTEPSLSHEHEEHVTPASENEEPAASVCPAVEPLPAIEPTASTSNQDAEQTPIFPEGSVSKKFPNLDHLDNVIEKDGKVEALEQEEHIGPSSTLELKEEKDADIETSTQHACIEKSTENAPSISLIGPFKVIALPEEDESNNEGSDLSSKKKRKKYPKKSSKTETTPNSLDDESDVKKIEKSSKSFKKKNPKAAPEKETPKKEEFEQKIDETENPKTHKLEKIIKSAETSLEKPTTEADGEEISKNSKISSRFAEKHPDTLFDGLLSVL